MANVGLLILRLVVGGLVAGHGAQKLFGLFGGHGVPVTAGFMESLGLRPGRPWALAAGWSEFGGGVLTALGLLNPLGPLGVTGAMVMAWIKAHRGTPIWGTEGGPEQPLTNLAAVTAVALAGPGALSLDRMFGIKLPRWILIPGLIGVAATAAYGFKPAEDDAAPSQAADAAAEEAGAEL